MSDYQANSIKWPYVTHLIDRERFAQLLPVIDETNPGSLLLARVVTIGRHRELESHEGRKITLFAGDLFVGALGHRYATDQFEGVARCSGPLGHIVGIGGVVGEVVSRNNRMTDPTVIEYLGRLADSQGRPLHLRQFQQALPLAATQPKARSILSLGASMNSGKTTTAAQMVRSLTSAGYRVVAAKITGTACRKDPNLLADAGAAVVLDFTYCGWPSTAGCTREQLLEVASNLRTTLLAHEPDFIVYEIADGIVQRETQLLLADPWFRSTIAGATFAASDALSCEMGVRRLRELGYQVIGTAGMVANSPLGVAEVESISATRCYPGEAILAGALVEVIAALPPARPATVVSNPPASLQGSRETLRQVTAIGSRLDLAPTFRAVR